MDAALQRLAGRPLLVLALARPEVHDRLPRLWHARAHLAPPLRRRRVFDALTRRGFPPEKISEIIRGWYAVD